MRRAPGLVDLSRRQFCGFAAAAAGVALGACGGDPGGSTAADAQPGSPDANSGGACTGALVDVGAASGFATGAPKYFSSGRFFVARDAKGVYALSAACTHEGATCQVSSGEIYCPRHGATFTYDGAVIGGPVSRPLAHYAMCVMANGHLGVDTTRTVTASTRLMV